MLLNNRIIHNDNGTLRDLSKSLNNVFSVSETVGIVAAQDFLYIGSDLPFNHRFFLVDPDFLNSAASVASVEFWNGTEWIDAVDVTDQTVDPEVSGATLSQSGILSWVTDRNKSWSSEDTTELMDGSGLETLKIYNMYWVRITFSGNLTNTTKLKYVGHKFSNDEDLAGYYPDLLRANVMEAYKALKEDWTEQHVLAAEEIIRDLRKRSIVVSGSQMFNWELFADAAVHKVAEIAYTAFGPEYIERKEAAREAYDEALDKVVFPVDKNADGRISSEEKTPAFGRLVRS